MRGLFCLTAFCYWWNYTPTRAEIIVLDVF